MPCSEPLPQPLPNSMKGITIGEVIIRKNAEAFNISDVLIHLHKKKTRKKISRSWCLA